MSEKARQFRSLLLESLECRSVFSADGIEVWHFSQSSLHFDVDRFQSAQYPRTEATSSDSHVDSQSTRDLKNSSDFDGVKFSGRRSSHGSYGFGSSMHRGRFNDAPLPPADGEGPSRDIPTAALDSTPKFDSKSVQVPTQSIDRVIVIVSPALAELVQSRDSGPANPLSRPQLDSRGAERVDSLPNGNPANSNSTNSNSTGTSSLARVQASSLPNPSLSSHSQTPAALNSFAPLSGATGQVNLASASSQALSSVAPGLVSGTATFDLSEKTDGLVNLWADGFRFTRPIPVPSDAIADQAIAEQAVSEQASVLESLEKLLPGLAENHLRNRTQSGFDANQPNARQEKNWRPEASASVEVAFADGGMIALALNRDIAMSELEELSDDASSENKAWIANVGIFRAFENGAVAVTEYAGLTNRVIRNAASNASPADMSEVEGEVANSQLHPLLASTSAALGVVMLGLRRMRSKTVPLLFTSRKR